MIEMQFQHKTVIRVVALLAGAIAAWALLVQQIDTPLPEAEVGRVAIAEAPLPDFSAFRDAREKKRAFFDYLLPVVEAQNAQLRAERDEVERMFAVLESGKKLREEDQHRLAELAEEYQVDTTLPQREQLTQLRKRVDIVPVSLALSQAANESGWGTSRFAREANNLFGEWCFRDGCGVVPERRSKGARHEVARFDSTRDAIASYMRNLNTHAAYRDFRERREQLRATEKPVTGIALVGELERYSERGNHYVRELRAMILSNELQRFDTPARFDPAKPRDDD